MAAGNYIEPIGSIIRRILSKKGLKAGVKEGETIARWGEIVGKTIAKRANAVALEQGILFLRVEDSAWRNELAMLTEELIKKVNDHFGERRVDRIYLI